MGDQDFDLVVIGCGPAGQKGAICAAKLRKRVAVIDRTVMMGGVCVHTGTIPSKSVREAIFQLTGSAVKSFYGNAVRGNGDISGPGEVRRPAHGGSAKRRRGENASSRRQCPDCMRDTAGWQ